MKSASKTILPGLIVAAVLAGCAQGQTTWYEEKCLRTGFKQGTAEFDKCVDRDRKWDEITKARVKQPPGVR